MVVVLVGADRYTATGGSVLKLIELFAIKQTFEIMLILLVEILLLIKSINYIGRSLSDSRWKIF